MADMKQLTINGTTYDLVDTSAVHCPWEAIADLNSMTGYMGRVYDTTLNRPLIPSASRPEDGFSNGQVIRLKHGDAFEQQYIFFFGNTGVIASRVKSNGEWTAWKYIKIETQALGNYTGTAATSE